MSDNAPTQTPTTAAGQTASNTATGPAVLAGGNGNGNASRWSHSTDSRPTADVSDTKSAASDESPMGISAASMSGTYSGNSANVAEGKLAQPAKAVLVATDERGATPTPATRTDTTATVQTTSGDMVDMFRGVDTELVQILNSSGANAQAARPSKTK